MNVNRRTLVFCLLAGVFASVGVFALAQDGANIRATNNDQLAFDANSDGLADPDDVIVYTVTIGNCGSETARDISYTSSIDPQTELVPGSLSVSAPAPAELADCDPLDTNPPVIDNDGGGDSDDDDDETVTAPSAAADNMQVSNGATITENVLDNDTGNPSPAALTFGGPDTSNAGDTPADGSTTYTAPSGIIYTLDANGNLTIDASALSTGSTGSDTLFYIIENEAGTSTGEITVTYGDFPTAVDDAYQQDVNTNFGTGSGDAELDANDAPGMPAGSIVAFGGGDLGGDVTDNAAGSTIAFPAMGADAQLTVDADGTWSATQSSSFNTGLYTFEYQLDNGIGTSTAVVTLTVEQGPTAANDTLEAAVGGTTNFPTGTLFDDNGGGADDLGAPPATISNFGGFNGTGAVTDNNNGETAAIPAPVGGTLTVNDDGSFSVTNPTTTGTFTFIYRLANGAGTSDATVTINVVGAPVPADDAFTFVSTSDQPSPDSLFNDNGSGADALGTPTGTITGFGGGDLGGTGASNAPGSSVSFAGGTLNVNSDGTWSLTGQPFDTSQTTYTFDYVLENSQGSNTATVTIEIQQAPTAVADAFTIELGAVDISVTAPGIFANDTLGNPAAALVDYGAAGTRGVTAGTPYTLPGSGGVTVSVTASGALTVDASGGSVLAGNYTFEYLIQNVVNTSEAIVTLQVAATTAPTAVDDGPFNTPLNTAFDSTIVPVSVLNNDTLLGATITALNGTAAGNPTTTITTTGGGTVVMDTNPASSNVGTWTYTPASGFTGTDSFTYTLDNGDGTDSATVTITVGDVPLAADDTTANGVTYGATINTPLNSAGNGDPAITLNDTLNGAQISAVGATSCGAFPTFSYPCSGTTANGGTLAVNSDGSFIYTPAPGFVGVDTVSYTLQNGNGTDAADIEITVQAPPIANDDGTAATPAYTVVVGGSFTSTAASGVRNSNDEWTLPNVLPDAEISGYTDGVTNATVGNPLTLDGSGGITVTITLNGTITVNATAGTAVARDYTVTYTLANAAGNDTAVVFISVTEAPVVTLREVQQGAGFVNVTTTNTQINSSTGIRITFSEPVNVTGDWFTLVCGASGAYNISGSGATALVVTGGPSVFTLSGVTFAEGETCNATVVAANITDQNTPSSAMATNNTFAFTIDETPALLDVEAQQAGPTFVSVVPDNTGILANSSLRVSFDEAMTLNAGWLELTCSVSGALDETDFTVTPNAGNDTFVLTGVTFTSGETCTGTIVAANIADVDAGDPPNTIPADVAFEFTTVDVPPQVTGTTPLDGATVANNQTVTLNFSEAVNVAAGAFSATCGGSPVTVTFTPQNGVTSIIVNPNTQWTNGANCTLTADAANITDSDTIDTPTPDADQLDGNNDGTGGDDFTLDFTVDTQAALTLVQAEVGGTFTTIAGTFPANGLSGVDSDTAVRLTFSETVNNTDGVTLTCSTSGTLITNGGGLVTAGNGSTQLTITRSAGTYAAGEICTISFTTGSITDTDVFDPPNGIAVPVPAIYEFEVTLAATDDTFNVTSHLEARFDTVAPGTTNVLTNDGIPAGSTVTAVNGGGIGSPITLPSGAVVTMEADGDFNYVPPPGIGNNATNTFTYTVQTPGGATDTATVTITIEGPVIWYVDEDATGPTYNGTAAFPFADLTGANSFNAGAPDAPNQYIFVYDSTSNGSTLQCGLTLLGGQQVIGEGESANLNTLTGRAPVPETVGTPPNTTGNQPQLTSTGDCFTLSINNTVRGLDIGNTNGYAFRDGGATVGALTISDVSITGNGGIVSLTNGGALIGIFNEFSSSAFAGIPVNLMGMNGTVASTSGFISNASNNPTIAISGGSIVFNPTTTINKSGGIGAVLQVNNGHNGAVTLTSTITATSGSGLQFNNADGTYNLTGEVNILGTSAGVSIVNGSNGALNITNTGSDIEGIQGIPFRINNSTMDVDYNGDITHRAGVGSNLTFRTVEIIGGTGVISFDGTIATGDAGNRATAETVFLQDTDVATTITFNYVDTVLLNAPAFISSTSGNVAVNRFRINCDGNLGVDNHCVDISDTTSSGVTIEALRVDHDDASEAGGALSLVNTPGTWTVEASIGAGFGLAGRDAVLVYGLNFGILNIATVDSPTSPDGVTPFFVTANNRAAFDLTNGTVNINTTYVQAFNTIDHGIRLVNVAGPLFQLSESVTSNGVPGSSSLIFMDNVLVSTINIGTNGITPSTVILNQRFDYGIEINANAPAAIFFGNTSIPDPNGTGLPQTNITGTAFVNFASLTP